MVTIKWPVVANEHGDLNLLRSARDLESRLELQDIQDGEYIFFDATGRRLSPVVDSLYGVRLEVADDGTDHQGEIREAIIAYLAGVPTERQTETRALECASFDDLWDSFVTLEEDTPRRRQRLTSRFFRRLR